MSRQISKCPKCKYIDTLRFKIYDVSGFIYECFRCGWNGHIDEIYVRRKDVRRKDK